MPRKVTTVDEFVEVMSVYRDEYAENGALAFERGENEIATAWLRLAEDVQDLINRVIKRYGNETAN